MPAHLATPMLVVLSGAGLLVAGQLLMIRSGARSGMGRRLAGAREIKVGALFDSQVTKQLPDRPIRVVGRIRCADPILTPAGDRLVAYHRDVEVRMADGRWRNIERLRETRSFDLWDHDGWLAIDPAQAAEPLVVLPRVWEGAIDDLDEGFGAAVARLRAEGRQLAGARASTRMVSVTDRLALLARVEMVNGAPRLAPPRAGYTVTNLEIDEAMRVLGGPHRWRLLSATAVAALGVAMTLLGLALAVIAYLSAA